MGHLLVAIARLLLYMGLAEQQSNDRIVCLMESRQEQQAEVMQLAILKEVYIAVDRFAKQTPTPGKGYIRMMNTGS